MDKSILMLGDCLEKMKEIPDGSIDAVICDPPYGTTACKWDTVIPFEPMWQHLKRITKKNGAIVLFGSQPFTSALVMSNKNNYSHQWLWIKEQGANPLLANKQPMKNFEDILVFGVCQYDEFFLDSRRDYFKKIMIFIGKNKSEIIKETNQGLDHCFRHNSLQFGIPTEENYKLLTSLYGIDKMVDFIEYGELKQVSESRTYNPQMTVGKKYKSGKGYLQHLGFEKEGGTVSDKRYPLSTIYFQTNKTKSIHPTQKPVSLMEYLIKTYTNEGETVLDFTMGSGTTGVACKNLGRNFIGIEKEEEYFKIAEARINAA